MGKMQQLALDVQALEKQLAACTQCGMCQAGCPLFAQTRKEGDVSRGKLALIDGLIHQVFSDAKGVDRLLKRCLLCGSCAAACPSNVNTLEIFLKARQIITDYLGLPLAKKIVFRKVLADPKTFNTLARMAAPFQRLLFKKQDNLQGTSCARVASPLLRHRHIVSLNQKPFNADMAVKTALTIDNRVDGKGVKVAFFVGCLIDKAFPNIAHSVVDLLTHFKARTVIPESQGCCGIPAAASGDGDTFESLVRLNAELFDNQECDYIVTACATCASTIIKLWPSLVSPEDEALSRKVARIAAKTVDISWLMEKRFDIFGETSPADNDELPAITYHDPCHLKKSLGVWAEPRRVIEAAGFQIKEMKNSDTCCGMGGSFNLEHYGLSSEIGKKKAADIIETGCPVVATSCPACMMQISDMLAKSGENIAVRHPVEIYAQHLGVGRDQD